MNPTIAPRPLERLSHRQRELTPIGFAHYLVDQVRLRTGSYWIAALWVRGDSPYRTIEGVECWSIANNAYLYRGPHPVICHPPCGPWGRYRAVSRQDKAAGPLALLFADLYGGVVEQPASSGLFRGGEALNQVDFGHLAEKATRLYWSRGGAPA